jgi:hypothetical protein
MNVKTVRISNRQYVLLREFAKVGNMTMVQAQEWDQRAFRSFLVRGWLAWNQSKGFVLSPDGYAALEAFHRTDIRRADPTRPITRYFDSKLYKMKGAA